MAIGRDLKNRDNHVVCIVGDGAMSAGQAYEALNNAGAEKSKLIVILNDNDMSIAPPAGAPAGGAIDISLSFKITISFDFSAPALFSASYA